MHLNTSPTYFGGPRGRKIEIRDPGPENKVYGLRTKFSKTKRKTTCDLLYFSLFRVYKLQERERRSSPPSARRPAGRRPPAPAVVASALRALAPPRRRGLGLMGRGLSLGQPESISPLGQQCDSVHSAHASRDK